jgi:hypothetical protein
VYLIRSDPRTLFATYFYGFHDSKKEKTELYVATGGWVRATRAKEQKIWPYRESNTDLLRLLEKAEEPQ